MKKLTAMEQKAADHFILHRKKVGAYRHAYSVGNMAEKTMYRKASLVFSREHVKAFVDAAIAKISKETGIDAAWVLERSVLLASFNINKFLVFKKGVALYDFAKATDDDWYCIGEITIDQVGVSEDGLYLVDKIKLKSVDKLKALDQVGRNVGVQAFKESVVVQAAVVTAQMSTEDFKETRRQMLKEDEC